MQSKTRNADTVCLHTVFCVWCCLIRPYINCGPDHPDDLNFLASGQQTHALIQHSPGEFRNQRNMNLGLTIKHLELKTNCIILRHIYSVSRSDYHIWQSTGRVQKKKKKATLKTFVGMLYSLHRTETKITCCVISHR